MATPLEENTNMPEILPARPGGDSSTLATPGVVSGKGITVSPGDTPYWRDRPKAPATGEPVEAAPQMEGPKTGVISAALTPDAPPTPRAVGRQETIAGQLEALQAKDSDFMKSARFRGQQQARARGLQNTTMAAQAGEAGAMESALAIATGDAATYRAAAEQASAFSHDTGMQTRAAEIAEAMEANKFDYNKILTQMDQDNRLEMEAMQQEFQTATQTSAEANAIVKGAMAAIAAIVTTQGITPAEITRATNIINDQTRTALSVMESDLSDIFPSLEMSKAAAEKERLEKAAKRFPGIQTGGITYGSYTPPRKGSRLSQALRRARGEEA